ncbi:hypothetical protein QJQ45_029925 [Haematococcus lacustris]|nr:hypothetical protein QJQ45_029925 [Haematococcus lacustris]
MTQLSVVSKDASQGQLPAWAANSTSTHPPAQHMHAQAHGADQVALLNNPHLLPVVGLAGCAAGSPSPALLHQVLAPAAQQQRVELEHSLLPLTASDSSQPRQLRPRLELPLPLASVHCQGVEQHAGQGQHLLAAPRASPQGQHLSGAPAGQSSSSSSRPQAPGLPAPAVHHQQPCSSLPLASSPLPLHPDTSPEATAHSLAGHAAVPGVKPAPPPPAVPIPASPGASSEAAAEGAIPQPIMIICCVSAALTLASCVFNTLLPVYMVTELKMSMRSMGMFEGVLEAISYVVRMFSGVVSDMMSSRKTAITAGFALGALAKFGVVGSSTVAQLFASKAVDRLANGVQAAPRDALISDLAPAASRSACFGFAQSLRKWGSFVGAGLSFLLMKASGNNYKLIFLMAATVSVASCLAFVVLVPNHSRPLTPQQQAAADQQAAYSAQQAQLQAAATAAKPSQPGSSSSSGHGQAGVPGDLAAVRESGAGLRGAAGLALAAPLLPRPEPQGRSAGQLLADVRNMGPDFYRMLLTVSLYGMGHIAEALLEARAIEVGFGKAESTLVVCCLAFVIFLVAYPLGRLDDRYGPRVTFAVGMTALILGNLTLLMSGAHPHAVFLACAFLGVHWGVIQGPMLSIVVGLAPASLRGTAFGIFYTVMAATALAANTLYGSLWTMLGAPAMFATSATLMTATLPMFGDWQCSRALRSTALNSEFCVMETSDAAASATPPEMPEAASPSSLPQQSLGMMAATALTWLCIQAWQRLTAAAARANAWASGPTGKALHLQLRGATGSARMLALVVPFARAVGSESLTALYARTFERAAFGFAKMYLFCLFMRVLLSWFPGIDWNANPWTFLRLITEPYLQIYRGILPPLFGQLDFTPLFGFLILQVRTSHAQP